MGGTQNTGAVKPSSPPVAAWVDLARRLAHDPTRGWRSAAWPLSPSRLDASVSSTEPHTPAPDETRACRWLPLARSVSRVERQEPLQPRRLPQSDCLDPSGFLCRPRHRAHNEPWGTSTQTSA
jgi:hypothetical protein